MSFLFKKFYFIWLHWILVVACQIKFPGWSSNPGPPALGACSLSHCTTREVSSVAFLASWSGFTQNCFLRSNCPPGCCPAVFQGFPSTPFLILLLMLNLLFPLSHVFLIFFFFCSLVCWDIPSNRFQKKGAQRR